MRRRPSDVRGARPSTSDAPALEQLAERRQRRADPSIVGDRPVVERHVEVDADEDARRRRGRRGRRAFGASTASHASLRARRRRGRRGRRGGSSSPTRCRTSRSTFDDVAHRHRRERVERARRRAADDVARDDRVLACRRACRRAARSRPRPRNAALTSSTVTSRRQGRDEVGDRAVGHRHAHRHAVELALQVRQHEPRRLRGAGRRRDDVDRGGARAPQVLVRQVEDASGRSCTRAPWS